MTPTNWGALKMNKHHRPQRPAPNGPSRAADASTQRPAPVCNTGRVGCCVRMDFGPMAQEEKRGRWIPVEPFLPDDTQAGRLVLPLATVPGAGSSKHPRNGTKAMKPEKEGGSHPAALLIGRQNAVDPR